MPESEDLPESRRLSGVGVRVGHLEDEVGRLRSRTHDHASQIEALKILAEVGNEQRGELIKDVVELKARVTAESEMLRADMKAGFSARDRSLRWVVTLSMTAGATAVALLEQILRHQ